jgi:hypothetical protein
VFAADKAIQGGIVATGPNPEHPAAAIILATDVRPVSIPTSNARDPNATFQNIPAECLTRYNKRPSTRPEDTDATEQQDIDSLFKSNRYDTSQLAYDHLDDSSRDQPSCIQSRFNTAALDEVDPWDQGSSHQQSRFNTAALDEVDPWGQGPPHQRSRLDTANLETINPAILNI